jgi:hypothetical protein
MGIMMISNIPTIITTAMTTGIMMMSNIPTIITTAMTTGITAIMITRRDMVPSLLFS